MDLKSVCQFLIDAKARQSRTVLVTVGAVEGSSMRNPGTIMGVAEDGSFAGSLSGGCIENAVVAEALDVLRADQPRVVRFGAGSPYLDIRLPCGGGLDLAFHPLNHEPVAAQCLASIDARQPFAIRTGPGGVQHLTGWHPAQFDPMSGAAIFGHWPEPQLQIIGHGAGVEALAVLGRTHGCSIRILTSDARIIAQLRERGIEAQLLKRTDQTELLAGDPWTATIFLFHDHDWEIALIERALDLPHFYIGAMGGRRAHEWRSTALRAQGVSEPAIASIHAPLGLFHSSRDPQTLALSALAEVIRAYQDADFEAQFG